MSKYWLSWYAVPRTLSACGKFKLESPWWVTGWRVCDKAKTICAAILAESEDAAKEIIFNSYDKRPCKIEFRFVEKRYDEWSPFDNARFHREGWMKWDCDAPAKSDESHQGKRSKLMSSVAKKPPLGLPPYYVETRQRIYDILSAMGRYFEADQPIPIKWAEELTQQLVLLKAMESNHVPKISADFQLENDKQAMTCPWCGP